MIQRCLPRPIFDHFPILLDSDGVRTGPSTFRFELMWLKFEGFNEILKGWWQNLQFHALRMVTFWDDLEKERGLGLEEIEDLAKTKDDFKSWVLLEEIFWRQKSKETWLKEGDRNARFFHNMANAHRRRNCFKSISINDRRLDKEAEIKEGLVDAFQNLLSAPGDWHPTLPDIALSEILPEDATKL